MPFTCDAIIFDLDGVLIDSHAITARHLRSWAERHGIALAEILAINHGRTTVETVRTIAPHLDAEREAMMMESAEASDLEGLAAFPGASRLLAKLAEHPWAIWQKVETARELCGLSIGTACRSRATHSRPDSRACIKPKIAAASTPRRRTVER